MIPSARIEMIVRAGCLTSATFLDTALGGPIVRMLQPNEMI